MTEGQTGPLKPKQDEFPMSDSLRGSDPSHSTLPESVDDESDLPQGSLIGALLSGLFKLVGVALLVYLTYFFTTEFANRTPPPARLTEEKATLAKKADELRAQGTKLLTTYGWVDPVTKSKVRIPIDRAMELVVAESNRPPAPRVPVPGLVPNPASPSGKPGTGQGEATKTPGPTPGTEIVVAPAPPPAPAGMPPEQMYRMVCMACHDADGKGKIVKLAMPTIPDLTDPKFHASRTDAELTHSILEGKESTVNGAKIPLMLSMKDKLALAHTDVKDMVKFMRAFKDGKQIVSATPSGPALVPGAPDGPAPSGGEIVKNVPPPTPAPGPSPSPAPAPGDGLKPAPEGSKHVVVAGNEPPKPVEPTKPMQPGPKPPSPSGPTGTRDLAAPLPGPVANTAARAEKIRLAGNTFNTVGCVACHGADGKGTAVRPAMPVIPDFTSRDFHTSRSSSQLVTSILEGKGTLMIPWNTKLTPDQARDLVLYVRNFGPADLVEAETAPGQAAPSLVEFDNKLRSLRQQFDEVEKQLQTLPGSSVRP